MGAARGLQGQVGVINQSKAQVVNGSLRFDSTQTQYLSRTPGSAGNRRTWTWSGWYKRGKLAPTRPFLFGCDTGTGGNDFFAVEFESSGDKLQIQDYGTGSPSGQAFVTTSQVFRDPSAWYHIVIAVDTTQATNTDRIKVYVNGVRITAFSQYDTWTQYYQTKFNRASETSIGNLAPSFGASGPFDGMMSQVYFIDGQALDSSYFGFTDPLTNTWRPKKFSGSYTSNPDGYGIKWSDYVTGSVYSSSYYNGLLFDGNATDSTVLIAATTQTFTPPTPIPVSSSLRVYVNKNGSGSTFTVNGTSYAGSTTEPGSWVTIPGATQLSTMTWGTSGFNMERPSAIEIDGTILVDYQGTNSFYLPFDTDGVGTIGIGTDRSGRGNHWTANGFVTTAAGIQTNPNIMPDSPSGISFSTAPTAGIGTTTGMTKPSNYATLNPLDKNASLTLTNGNLTVTGSSTAHRMIRSTIGVSGGKWYWEVNISNGGGSPVIGIAKQDASLANGQYVGANATSWGYSSYVGDKYNNGSSSSYGASYTTGDVIGIALDADNGILTFYKNNASQGTAFSGLTSGPYFPAVSLYDANDTYALNFGQKPFKYAPPSGFLPLCTANLPRPTTDAVVRPDKYVGIVTYTGNGSTQSINVGFKPDLVWIKNRNGGANNVFQDSVRGFGSSKNISSNQTQAEGVDTDGVITGVTNTGFNVAINAGSGNGTNRTNYTYVGWAWKAGGSGGGYSFWKDDIGYSTASAAGLTAGTITPTGASVNTKSGFSIITYTGGGSGSNSTISHGLGKVPQFMIVKKKSADDNWAVYHQAIGNDYDLYLNGTGGRRDYPSWGDTTPTSTVFTVGTTDLTNDSSNSFVAYIWAEIPGFSKIGSYSGTGVAGNFVQTGFRPKWIMIKNYSGGVIGNWGLVDSTRSYANVANHTLAANLGSAESAFAGGESVFGSGNKIDLVSNGFVLREGNAWANETSTSYIYIAFAETPSFNLYGGQSNAR